ncbi:MAG TPA: DUF4153 domain-containing protein [Alteraurantiacibacter sp.]|jgi:hypothetical protein
MAEPQDASSPAGEAAIEDWPLRPWVLAAWLGLAGLLIHFLSDNAETDPARMAATALVFFGAVALAFTFDPQKWREPAIFAGVAGLVMAGIAWRATNAGDHYSDEGFWIGAGIIAVTLALPLFQAGFHRHRFRTSYSETHFHVWTDAISGAGALAFTGISWALLALLANLFDLIGIDLLMDAIDEEWFGWTFSGAAFGAALGTLRNELKILGAMQNVVMLVLSLLAVPLALALVIFLAALLLSGLQVLWDATESPTPMLLACAVGAFVLANTILRDSEEQMRKSWILRVTALILALSILPLVGFAAISMGTRVAQHGLSPERIWAMIAIAVACAYGLAYWVAAARGRKAAWAARLREANLHLAAAISVIAFVLALPILDFGAVSARNQIARLEAGTVSAEEFDYAALRWDFGDAGRAALKRLAQGSDEDVAERAQLAIEQTERPYGFARGVRIEEDYNLVVRPGDPKLRAQLLAWLKEQQYACRERCLAIDLGLGVDGRREVALLENYGSRLLAIPAGDGQEIAEVRPPQETGGPLEESSDVEVREIAKRYVFIDGKPLPQPLD